MKKTILFVLSITVALGITIYTKNERSKNMVHVKTKWKTFVKTSNSIVDSHGTTQEEFLAAKIPTPPASGKTQRSIASVNPYQGFMVRNNRIITGDLNKKYEDENNDLQMANSVNPEWKDIMGNDLMRFQPADTKLMVKEEVPVIKIVNGIGRYLEQVTVTYLQKNGSRSSFKALVDSETGTVVETWDRTIHEHIRPKRGGIILPSNYDSGLITR
jgi:hypothetical protein